MKKRLTAILLTAVMLVSTAIIALAAGGVELPMIPIVSSTVINVKLSSSADGYASTGSDVVFTTGISEIGTDGLSRVEISYTYSDGLVFNDDVRIIGLPEGWTVSEAVCENNNLSFTAYADSNEDSIQGRNLDITFSFRVATVSGSSQALNFSNISLYDKYGSFISRVSQKVTNNAFVTEASVPAVKNIGASLRINNGAALRFGMLVSKDSHFNRAFPDGFTYSKDADMQFGMLVIEKTDLSGELTIKSKYADVVMFEKEFSSNVNEIVFVATVDKVTNYKKEYTFRPFVKYRETPDGEYQYHYGETKTRSAKTVAEMELVGETSSKKIEMLKKFI